MALLDTVWTYKFIKIISTKWTDQDAYKLGIIDDKGAILKPLSTLKSDEEKKAYTLFHRLAWNVKRTIERFPGGESKLKRYGSALFLIKEEAMKMGFSEEKATMFESALHDRLNESFLNNIIGSNHPLGKVYTYSGKDIAFIERSAKERGMKVTKAGKTIKVVGDPNAHRSMIKSFQSLGNVSGMVESFEWDEFLSEEPTNVIGNAGEGDIDTFDPLLKNKKVARRKKKTDEDLEDEKNETPARTNEGLVGGNKSKEDLGKEYDIMMGKGKSKKPKKSSGVAGWIAFYKSDKLEIKIGKDAKDLYSAKKFAIKHFKVPKSKQGLLAIAPAYNESTEYDSDIMNIVHEAMKRRKKRNAHGRVDKFYKRIGDCPPGKVKNRKGGCEKMKGNRSLAQVKKTKRLSAKKKKRTEKKFSSNSSHWKKATRLRKRTARA